jgi:cobalamin biosynthesis protein CobD/CbiB
MPGGGHSESAAVRTIGAIVALIAVVGYLILGWSFSGSDTTVPTVIGVILAASAIGWTLYNRVSSDNGT